MGAGLACQRPQRRASRSALGGKLENIWKDNGDGGELMTFKGKRKVEGVMVESLGDRVVSIVFVTTSIYSPLRYSFISLIVRENILPGIKTLLSHRRYFQRQRFCQFLNI